MTRILYLAKNLLLLMIVFYSSIGEAERQTLAIFTCQSPETPAWDPDSTHAGIAGSEEAVIHMAKELADLGYKVTVFNNPPKNSRFNQVTENPRFASVDELAENDLYDIAISWRMPPLGKELKSYARTVYFWPHDKECPLKIGQEQIEAFNDVLWLSDWQRQVWVDKHPDLARFTRIFGNGVNPKDFAPINKRKNPYSCIYGSNYGLGLAVLLNIWPEIKEQFPKATLDIYYGWTSYGALTPEQASHMKKQINNLKSLGVTEHGKVGHKELHKAFSQASFWTYPCIGTETFSITALKAQIAGAIPVVITAAALAETVGTGYRCSSAEQYKETLLKALSQADTISRDTRMLGRNFVTEHYTWKKIALQWKELFDTNITGTSP